VDFGDTTTSLRLNVENEGQSNLFWNIDFSLFPNWLSITNSGDNVCAGDRDTITLAVTRENVSMVNQSFTFDIESDYGTETITVLASPAP
jgi:hypothetical protein